jgi:hypothetical protein
MCEWVICDHLLFLASLGMADGLGVSVYVYADFPSYSALLSLSFPYGP